MPEYSKICRDMARNEQICADITIYIYISRYGQICEDMARYSKILPDMPRYGQIWPDRYSQILARYPEMGMLDYYSHGVIIRIPIIFICTYSHNVHTVLVVPIVLP